MSPTAHQLSLKTTAMMAMAFGTAVVLRERFAAFVSFRWHQPSFPPTQNEHSAASPVFPAVQFSGNNTIYAVNAVTTVTF